MNKLRAKLKKEGGFTLIEMLIVVAIVAILVAISIPIVNNSLEKARDATDDANFRSAAALANIKVLTEDLPSSDATYYYKVTNTQGDLATAKTEAGVYVSKCKEASGSHTETGTGKDMVIEVKIKTNGEIEIKWVSKS